MFRALRARLQRELSWSHLIDSPTDAKFTHARQDFDTSSIDSAEGNARRDDAAHGVADSPGLRNQEVSDRLKEDPAGGTAQSWCSAASINGCAQHLDRF